MQVFTEYFTQLYAAPVGLREADVQEYFENIALVWFEEAHRAYLDMPFTVEEVAAAILSLPGDKSPGVDGLTPAFYKEYVDILAPCLLEVYAESLETGSLPASLREALIITVLKPGKDPTRCDSYRPLSMINIDNKILAKMIVTRLQPLLSRLVLPDQ
ncbi:hypothetical protein NDU88_006374 [Pleurodeles waltl]|uniref:Uncharacterized protein n=1 Tax=Pleurodeles waltl TaxID=8319 RepID=A0AAV7N0N2_PLEWA|nr:hypothetical protein NDU88_006374 [Pleurodeles waltl]